jgi:hypothetical protein
MTVLITNVHKPLLTPVFNNLRLAICRDRKRRTALKKTDGGEEPATNGGNSFLDEIDDTLSAIENRLLNDIGEKRNLAEIILRR